MALRKKIQNLAVCPDAQAGPAEGASECISNPEVSIYFVRNIDIGPEFASSPVGEMNEFAALLIRWENEILNSFIPFRMEYVTNRSGKSFWKTRRLNSSLVENKNRVIQTLKRNANGFTNWKRFCNRVLYVLDPSVTFSIPSNPKEERNRNSEHGDNESQNDLKK